MTTISEARRAITAHLLAGLPYDSITDSETQVALPREDFDPPAGQDWMRAMVEHSNSFLEGFGGSRQTRKYTRPGSLTVQVFGPAAEEGQDQLDTICEAIRDRFEGTNLTTTDSPIRFTNASIREVGKDEDGWYQFNVECEFTYTQRK